MSDVQNQELTGAELELQHANEEIELFGTALRPFFTTDVAYNAVRSVVMSKLYDQMDLQTEIEAKAETAAEAARNEIAELYAQLDEQNVIVTGLKQDLYEMKLLAEDNGKKRDVAYNELLEAKRTIDELNDKIAATAVTVPKVVRTNADGDNSILAWKQSLPAIYDVQEHPDDRRKFIAKLAETDEPVEGLLIYKNGKYREVTPEEASTFRSEYIRREYEAAQQVEASSAGTVAVEDEPLVYSVPDFPSEDCAIGGVDEDHAAVALAGEAVTPEAFQQALERISALEFVVFTKGEAA